MPAQPAPAAPAPQPGLCEAKTERGACELAQRDHRGQCRRSRRRPRPHRSRVFAKRRPSEERMSGAAVAAAFAAGALSFATPCVLPLVPGYLAAIGIGDATTGRRAPAREVL